MELLYQNKFIVSLIIGSVISIVFYNYNKINNEPIDNDNEINNNNNNKDNSLYLFLIVSVLIFIILYFTEDNVDEVYNEIDTGEAPF